jgi:hypothetical protein
MWEQTISRDVSLKFAVPGYGTEEVVAMVASGLGGNGIRLRNSLL